MKTQLYIVGFDGRTPWEFVGVFDSEDKAIAACIDDNHFYGPAMLNVVTPKEAVDWPGARRPTVKEWY